MLQVNSCIIQNTCLTFLAVIYKLHFPHQNVHTEKKTPAEHSPPPPICIFHYFFFTPDLFFLEHNGHGHQKWGASIFWTWISKKNWKLQKIVKIAEKCAYEWFPSYFSKSMGVFPMHPVKTATVRVTKIAPFF